MPNAALLSCQGSLVNAVLLPGTYSGCVISAAGPRR